MQESIFCEQTNNSMTGGMVKSDYIMKSDGLRELEKMIVRNSPKKLRYSCNIMRMQFIDGFTFTEFLGGILVNSSSHALNCQNIAELGKTLRPEDIKNFVYDMAAVPDKYQDYTAAAPNDIDAALIMPGNNIIKVMVCRYLLEDIPRRYPNARIKPHPVTDGETLAELQKFMPCLPREVSAQQLIMNPNVKIFTTMASTMAIQTKLTGKEVFNLAEHRHQYVPPFQHLKDFVMTELGHNPETWRLQALLSNPLSGFFYPGYSTEDDIRAYYDKMLTYQPPADQLVKMEREWKERFNKKKPTSVNVTPKSVAKYA